MRIWWMWEYKNVKIVTKEKRYDFMMDSLIPDKRKYF